MVPFGSTAGPRLRAFPAVGFAFLMFVLRLAKRGCSQRATAFVQESLPPQACCQMQECSRARVRGACLSQRRHPTESEFKMGTLLSRVVTYPSGALRRAGASSGRAIAIAGRDARRGRRGAIYAEDRDGSLKSRALDGGRLSLGVLEFSQVSALLCIFTDARPRAYDRERSTSSSRVKPFHSRAQEFARARASESENKHGSPPDHP